MSALHGLKNDPDKIQISAPVQPGNSGGPLLDSSGNVIGVVTGKLDALNALARSGDLPQNVNFAISLSVLKDFLAQNGVRTTEAASRFELRPDEVGERAASFTYAIECEKELGLARSQANQATPLSPPLGRKTITPTTSNPSAQRERPISTPAAPPPLPLYPN